jgi:antirestriction protein ArdC
LFYLAAAVPPPAPGLIEPRVDALIKATGIDFRIGGNRAFYMPGADYVQVPPPQAYFEPINWHRADRAPRRLPWILAGGAERRQPCHHPRGVAGEQSG